MKKYILLLVALVATMSINAQVVRVYKNGVLDYTALNTSTDKYKVVFEESPFLNGDFTVAENKTVKFTKSNLYWDGSAFRFEAKPTDFPTSWNENHVGHFYSSQTASIAYGKYGASISADDNTLFCGESNKITVESIEDLYALSSAEWIYLINTRDNASSLYKAGVTVAGKKNCFIIAPDGYTNTSKPLSTTTSYTLDEINTFGLVCLPPAGYRPGDVSPLYYNTDGFYCSTTFNAGRWDKAYFFYFDKEGADPEAIESRVNGFSIRLVK